LEGIREYISEGWFLERVEKERLALPREKKIYHGIDILERRSMMKHNSILTLRR